MKKLLLHDPLEIGHHLVYAVAFTEWALANGYELYYSKCPSKGNFYEERYAENLHVHIIPYEVPGTDILRYFKGEGNAHQVAHIKKLQEELQPEITLFQYADRMMDEWDRMFVCGESFDFPTYCLLLWSAENSYKGMTTEYDQQLKKQWGANCLFDGIFVLNEYQACQLEKFDNVYYLPDPFRDFGANVVTFSERDRNNVARIETFLAQNNSKKTI